MTQTAAGDNTRQSVIFVHDAAIDEFMSTVLLTTVPEIDLLGIVVVNADCMAAPAMSVAWKLSTFTGSESVPIGLSKARAINPFPWAYRGDCVREDEIGALKPFTANDKWPPYPDGDALLTRLLSEADAPVTLLVTSPLTPVAQVLQAQPELASRVARLIWMGGAIRVGGNLDPTTVPAPAWNPYAEWNAYWDPEAVDWIFTQTEFPLVIFPLDVTNQAAITGDFTSKLSQQARTASYSALALQSYALVNAETFYDMWDVAATCWIPRPDIFEPPTPLNLTVDSGLAGSVGAIRVAETGRAADVVFELAGDGSQFYDYVLAQFDR